MHKKLVAAFLLLFFTTQQYSFADNPMQEALSAYLKKDFATAERIYLSIEEKDTVGGVAYNLGLLYERELKDLAKAIKFYTISSNKGFMLAQNNLATLYRNGNGVKKDVEKAINLYYEAASKGDEIAIKNLLQLAQENYFSAQQFTAYFYAVGPKKEIKRAYMWWNIAANNTKNESYLKQLNDLIQRAQTEMTEKQLEEANTLISSCISSRLKKC